MKAPSPPVSPWQLLYGGAHRLRSRWYRTRSRRLPRPVVSIGNLCWGGGGKTPITAAVAAHLRDRGFAVCILSRGYRRRGRGVRVVSVGEGPVLGPLVAGDEPVMLAGELPGVSVVVGADRYQAGLQALHQLSEPPGVFLLDDGFSHLALARDLDLVVLPAADPFARGRLAPSGGLREPLSSLRRADAVLLTGASEATQAAELAAALRPHGFTGPAFASRSRLGSPCPVGAGSQIREGARVLVVSAVARPEDFARAVRGLGFDVAAELRFGDHHRYPPASVERIAAVARCTGAEAVLTTAKDGVKLLGRLEVPAFVLPLRAEPEPAFWTWLEERLRRGE